MQKNGSSTNGSIESIKPPVIFTSGRKIYHSLLELYRKAPKYAPGEGIEKQGVGRAFPAPVRRHGPEWALATRRWHRDRPEQTVGTEAMTWDRQLDQCQSVANPNNTATDHPVDHKWCSSLKQNLSTMILQPMESIEKHHTGPKKIYI